jgi:hypothetical protein
LTLRIWFFFNFSIRSSVSPVSSSSRSSVVVLEEAADVKAEVIRFEEIRIDNKTAVITMDKTIDFFLI